MKNYEDKFGYLPGSEESLEYGPRDYKEYVMDIKKAIELNIDLASLYPNDDNDF